MTNDKSATTASSAGGNLTVTELADYLAKVFGEGIPPADLNASVSGNSLMVKSLSGTTPVSFDDATQAFLQFREEHVSMRQRPMTTTEALGIKGSFRIQVGTQGTRVASKIFSNANDPDLNPGDILGPGKAGDSYTFRVGAHDAQVDVR